MQADLHEVGAARGKELPGAVLTQPFGEEWDVWKVCGKIFMLQTVLGGEPVVILKASPADGKALREEFSEITPGYHMNKRHWITVHPGVRVDSQLMNQLVTESYLLVVENLPKTRRSVDAEAYVRAIDEA
ncbi:MmcQ/YjbR family DNA-binding protein [Paenarthrobacter sp. NPDC058040]|uniref:MmcQ/YjbR family DNA-binding protein n=1 Tax=unclassified Paenarthrobacter TaxID=2634190 RepID=UPI0036DE175C